jgi:hypothetical protein
MAQNKESKLWNELKNLNKNWHFTRVESSTINGIPDVHCVVNKQIFWLELKANTHKNLGMSKWQRIDPSCRATTKSGACAVKPESRSTSQVPRTLNY